MTKKCGKELHPLFNSWAWMRKMHQTYKVCDEWYKDFWKFAEDMGNRPANNYQIFRKNKELGYSKENCEWRETISNADKAQYQREWRKNNPEKVKQYDLKKYFKLSVDEYEEMKTNQHNKCKICRQKETAKVNGKLRNLAIDHCHKTGKIRGLLCTRCNSILGFSEDSVEVLQNVISYLHSTV